MEEYFLVDHLKDAEKKFFKRNHGGIILNFCSKIDQSLECVIYNIQTQKVERKLEIPPLFFLRQTYFE